MSIYVYICTLYMYMCLYMYMLTCGWNNLCQPYKVIVTSVWMCVCLCTCTHYVDVAISAPYEEQENAEGTVYVYLGSGEDVINRQPDEVRSKTSCV